MEVEKLKAEIERLKKELKKNKKDFADLSIEDQKRFLLECLDKNQPIDQNFCIKGKGFLYYYLVQYGTSFSLDSISIDSYFQPLD